MSGEAPNDDAAQLTQRIDDGIARMTALLKALDEYSMALRVRMAYSVLSHGERGSLGDG